MRLIAGLGNPGTRYADTPHNLGFEVADRLADRWGLSWRGISRWRAEVARAPGGEEAACLLKPMTFMNLSGEAVQAVAGFYGVESRDILVVVDDVNLPMGRLRLRGDGTDGGHNGLKSIIRHLGTIRFARLRIGCGPEDAEIRNRVSYVLGRFGKQERLWMSRVVEAAADAVEDVQEKGLEKAMSRWNALVVPPPDLPETNIGRTD
jgi:PTH1 family peptidyl-tRNA hydrolase